MQIPSHPSHTPPVFLTMGRRLSDLLPSLPSRRPALLHPVHNYLSSQINGALRGVESSYPTTLRPPETGLTALEVGRPGWTDRKETLLTSGNPSPLAGCWQGRKKGTVGGVGRPPPPFFFGGGGQILCISYIKRER